MKKPAITWLLFLILLTSYAQKQKNIVLSEPLATSGTEMKVKMGTQWMGKIWNFRFGEYAVSSSKNGWTTTNSKSNFFNTKTQSISKQKFSFVLSQGNKSNATVNAATQITMEELNSFQISPGLFIGRDELTAGSELFTAIITISTDTSATWSLMMLTSGGSKVEQQYRAQLTNGERNILIVPVNSNKYGEDSRSIPALGYELHEAGSALSALQYYGGGMLGLNKNIIWIDKTLEQDMQLILAAAMTAILQVKANSMVPE
jgi:hypothetical protein